MVCEEQDLDEQDTEQEYKEDDEEDDEEDSLDRDAGKVEEIYAHSVYVSHDSTYGKALVKLLTTHPYVNYAPRRSSSSMASQQRLPTPLERALAEQ
ncbi:hypothetical protein Slin14017_G034380 [Septoria linicola]|nr:hypothetical protein Slin14017_G034380 [Septoria linicola]